MRRVELDFRTSIYSMYDIYESCKQHESIALKLAELKTATHSSC
ncbi:MAG: hypothetical protein QXW71_02435 [Thermoplasmata archaeon]